MLRDEREDTKQLMSQRKLRISASSSMPMPINQGQRDQGLQKPIRENKKIEMKIEMKDQ